MAAGVAASPQSAGWRAAVGATESLDVYVATEPPGDGVIKMRPHRRVRTMLLQTRG